MLLSDIDDVIASLRSIIARCKKDNDRTGYFTALYLRMTIAVKNGIYNGAFQDRKRMERLVICFAERYIAAWHCYMQKQPCSKSWRYAFDGAHNTDNIVLQHLLLGINTHINLDLAIAAATVAPGNYIYNLQNDFSLINKVIAGLVDDVQECLSQVWPPMKLIARIMNGRHEAVLNFSIGKARDTAWANAILLANMTGDQKETHIAAMDNLVHQLSVNIEHPASWVKYALKLIRKTEYDKPAEIITLIENVVV